MQRLIDAMQDKRAELLNSNDYDNDVINYCLDWVDEMIIIAESYTIDEIKADKWVPVSERMPKETGFTMVTRKFAGEAVVSLMWFSFERKQWEMFSSAPEKDITAWMPLPEPYKEGE